MFTAENEHIFTVTRDLSVQACKNAILSLANVAWYMLHAVQSRSSAVRLLPAELYYYNSAHAQEGCSSHTVSLHSNNLCEQDILDLLIKEHDDIFSIIFPK